MKKRNQTFSEDYAEIDAATNGHGAAAASNTAPDKKPISLFTLTLWLRVGDALAILISGFTTFLILGERISGEVSYLYTNLIILGAVFAPIVIHWTNGYDTEACFDLWASWKRALFGLFVLTALALAIGFSFKATATFSRIWFGGWVTESALGIMLVRLAIVVVARRLRGKGAFNSRVIIVGAGRQGQRLYQFINTSQTLTMSVVGFVDDRADRIPETIEGVPVLGGVKDLVRIIRDGAVDQVFVSLPGDAEQRIREVIEYIAETPIKIRLAPDIATFDYLDRPFASLGGLPVLTLFDRPISGFNQFIKVLEDYVLGSIILAAVSPFMLVIAVAIKISSRGPVFFHQKREGFNNRGFSVWKFRSMRPESSQVPDLRQATANDARITRVGAFLRRTSLDELPQLFNVMAGDMSLVGPRPHAPSTKAGGIKFEEAVARYAARHRVKPGITGWAQVNGWRGETRTTDKLEHRLKHDLYYIDHWSLGFDLYILLRTAMAVWKQEQAY